MTTKTDVILFGATGFTGQLVAEYFAKNAKGATWAIAGRNREKLEKVLANIQRPDIPIHIADSNDVNALDKLASEARVICATAGPFAKLGKDVVRACARHGTSYCDITGEATFIRAMIDECHEKAKETKARIVHCAGFDSIPSDLGAHMAWDHAHRVHGEDLDWCKIFTGKMKGTFSGGTVSTILSLVDQAKTDKDVRRLLFNLHALDPDADRAPHDPFEDDQKNVHFDQDIERWTAPFLMAGLNTRIVRRSHALLKEDGEGYGDRFRYNEAMSFKKGPAGFLTATGVMAGMAGFFGLAALPTRSLIEKFVPAPGEGPSREAIDSGMFELHVVARTTSGKRIRGKVRGEKDPGYGETAKMVSETALGLAKDADNLPKRYGILTPASAMGMHLVTRLRAAGMTFDVSDGQ